VEADELGQVLVIAEVLWTTALGVLGWAAIVGLAAICVAVVEYIDGTDSS
jgi:hypothetical protein